MSHLNVQIYFKVKTSNTEELDILPRETAQRVWQEAYAYD